MSEELKAAEAELAAAQAKYDALKAREGRFLRVFYDTPGGWSDKITAVVEAVRAECAAEEEGVLGWKTIAKTWEERALAAEAKLRETGPATDDDLRAIYNDSESLIEELRRVYALGLRHGRASAHAPVELTDAECDRLKTIQASAFGLSLHQIGTTNEWSDEHRKSVRALLAAAGRYTAPPRVLTKEVYHDASMAFDQGVTFYDALRAALLAVGFVEPEVKP